MSDIALSPRSPARTFSLPWIFGPRTDLIVSLGGMLAGFGLFFLFTTLGLSVLLFAAGLTGGLVLAPSDYQQGDSFRIIYLHVPAAWMAMSTYASLAIASAVGLVWRHPLAEVAARAMAPLGAAFTALCLVTGSLWGKPMWGTWWVWDARLTSVLILFFLYLGYIALSNAFDDPTRGGRAAAVQIGRAHV